MAEARKLNVVLCWHMHQPDYRDIASGEFTLPWTYLHAIKDHTDMAAHLEQRPGAKAVFNFVPVLLDQLNDYAEQFASGQIRDPLLASLAEENMDRLSAAQRKAIFHFCFACNHERMVHPYPAFRRLHEIYKALASHGESQLQYLSGQYLADLVTWYHLTWTGETVRRDNELVARLMSQGSHFTHADRRALFDLIGELISGLIPRYRRLLEQGRISLSATPHFHPLAPLMLDFDSAREAWPDVVLPESDTYPGGRTRVIYHIESAREAHLRRFGQPPQGVWPAEGAISTDLAHLFAEQGFSWTASGEGVLANSLRALNPVLPERHRYLYHPYRISDGQHEIAAFFRDDRLSDLIGFEYARWYGRDAVNNFVHELDTIAGLTQDQANPVVSVILDGENAWEYYPYNGYYFLSELYEALENHPRIHLTTFHEYLARSREQGHLWEESMAELPRLAAGSWVYGTFSTWIGSPAKNRAWDLLCAAKQSYDLVIASGRLSADEQATVHRQLAICEGSDWFWWFGDYNPAHSVESFDKLYRQNLANLYRMLHLPVPEELDQPISRGGGHPETGGTMRRAT